MAKGSGTPPSKPGQSKSPQSKATQSKAGQSKSTQAKARKPVEAAVATRPPGPDLPALMPIAGLFVAVWASLPKWSGPKLNVQASTEVADHVIPAVLVLVCSVVAIAAGRRAKGPGGTRFLAGMGVLLAGLWMMATHLPLVAEANRGDAPWVATIYHTSAALAVFGLGLLWATVTWSEAGDDAKKPAAQAQK